MEEALFSSQAAEWATDITLHETVKARIGSDAASYDNFVIWFGGQAENGYLNDLWRINLANHKLSQIIKIHDHITPPKPYAMHSAVTIGNKMIVFGGVTLNNEGNNQIYAYDMDFQTWELRDVRSSRPSPRFGHQMVAFGDSSFLFGGVQQFLNDLWLFSLVKNQWIQLDYKNPNKDDIPSPRAYHTMQTNGTHLFVWGGRYS